MSPDELGVDLDGSTLSLSELKVPETESDVSYFEGNAEETASELASFLRDEKGVEA
jgi:electron transfer flavoprotein alpha/beta subunit